MSNRPLVYRDPYLGASTTRRNRLARALWGGVYVLLFRTSPRPLHAWRAFLLRMFGAKLGNDCHIYPRARIWAPWNLRCEDVVAIADDAEIYNPAEVRLASHVTVSQHAFICGATHDYNNPDFPMVSRPIRIGRHAWICARAAVQAGVDVGEGAVLALGSVATKPLEPWTVNAGVPARRVKMRTRNA